MKAKFLKLIALCLVLGLVSGCIQGGVMVPGTPVPEPDENVVPVKPTEEFCSPIPSNRPSPVYPGDDQDVFRAVNWPYFLEENLERYLRYHEKNPLMSFHTVVVHVNIGLDFPFYENVRVIDDPHSLTVLVNKYRKLPEGFVPELIPLDPALCVSWAGIQRLRPEAAEAFARMHRAAQQRGLSIQAVSTYRSISHQTSIWNNAVAGGRSIADTDRFIARPGHSEHHTGLAVDVIRTDIQVMNTREYPWYRDNAHLFGFIIRYPENKESITGYGFEPWHLRYLGVDLATAVYESGLTFDEFYVTMLEPLRKQE